MKFPSTDKLISIGAVMAALAVVLGAFGAHALRGKIGYDLFDIYQTGNQYLMIHAGAVILYGLWQKTCSIASPIDSDAPPTDVLHVKPWPAACFIFGSAIFSGSLYAITFTAIRGFGAITPIGGVLFIIGWLGFAYQAKSR